MLFGLANLLEILVSQTFGQPMATALLAQIQAMQQLPTSQAQQYLMELQRQQQIKVRTL